MASNVSDDIDESLDVPKGFLKQLINFVCWTYIAVDENSDEIEFADVINPIISDIVECCCPQYVNVPDLIQTDLTDYETSVTDEILEEDPRLKNWQKWLKEWRKQSTTTRAGVLKNQGYIHRTIKERHEVLEMSKGNRGKLFKHFQHLPRDFQYVTVPSKILEQMGLDDNVLKSRILQSQSFKSECQYYKEELKIVESHEPNLRDLIVIGQNIPQSMETCEELSFPLKSGTLRMLTLNTEFAEEFSKCILMINDHTLEEGHNYSSDLEIPMSFIANKNVISKQILALYNVGVKTIRFELMEKKIDWKLRSIIKQEPSKFYFNKNKFQIIPGKLCEFPIWFQSDTEGIFQEILYIKTYPKLFDETSSLVLNLWAYCRRSTDYKGMEGKCTDLDQLIEENTAKRAANKELKSVINQSFENQKIRTTVKICSTEEEVFSKKNPKLFYRQEYVEKLQQIFKEIDVNERSEWDLNVDTIRRNILKIESISRRIELFEQFKGIMVCLRIPTNTKERRTDEKLMMTRGLINLSIAEMENDFQNLEIGAENVDEAFQKIASNKIKEAADNIAQIIENISDPNYEIQIK